LLLPPPPPIERPSVVAAAHRVHAVQSSQLPQAPVPCGIKALGAHVAVRKARGERRRRGTLAALADVGLVARWRRRRAAAAVAPRAPVVAARDERGVVAGAFFFFGGGVVLVLVVEAGV
jgi:hypothetical protein